MDLATISGKPLKFKKMQNAGEGGRHSCNPLIGEKSLNGGKT